MTTTTTRAILPMPIITEDSSAPKPSPSTTSTASSTIMTLNSGGSGGSATPGTTAAPPSGSKRGRKPGPLSKTAREAQRRLNHSIIEKARRTKINDALATLKQLVPVDYLQTRNPGNDDDDILDNNNNNINDDEAGDDDDDDDQDDFGEQEEGVVDGVEHRSRNTTTAKSSKATAKAGSKGGKKQEKEKEFKLEILVRTVVFLQDLLKKVGHLEAAVSSKSNSDQCTTCGNLSLPTIENNKKRKRDLTSPSSSSSSSSSTDHHHHHHHHHLDDGHIRNRTKIARTNTPDDIPRFSPHQQRHNNNNKPSASSSPVTEKRLPPISSWLNDNNNINNNDGILPSPRSFGTFVGTVGGKELVGGKIYSPRDNNTTASGSSPSYLPSPPPSTHCFDPVRTYTSTTQVPFLNLGPGATSPSSSSSTPVGMATASSSSKPSRRNPAGTAQPSAPPTPLALTPEDESAASMLLQIATPQFRPINPPASSNNSRSTTTSPIFAGYPNNNINKNVLPEPTQFSLYSSHPLQPPLPVRRTHHRDHQPQRSHTQTEYDDDDDGVRQVETPSSILGIRKY